MAICYQFDKVTADFAKSWRCVLSSYLTKHKRKVLQSLHIRKSYSYEEHVLYLEQKIENYMCFEGTLSALTS